MDLCLRGKRAAAWLAAAAGAALVACAPAADAPLQVGAAASLREPLEEIAKRFEPAHPGARVQPVFGASNELAAQLRAGAPLDLLLSADEQIARQLAAEGLLGALRPFAANRLAVIASAEAAVEIAQPADLAGPAARRVALPSAAVPIGRYARQWLAQRSLVDAVEARAVQVEHVRAALAAVEAGNADAAIVYTTDARLARSSRIAFEIPADEQPRIAYVAGISEHTKQPEQAERFLAFLLGAEAAGILRAAGFAPPPEQP